MSAANITGTTTDVLVNDANLKVTDATKALITYGNVAIANTTSTASTLTVGSKVVIDESAANTLVVRGKAVIDEFELTANISAVNASFSGDSNVTGESNVGTFVSLGAATIDGATTISNTLTVSGDNTTTLGGDLGVSGATTLTGGVASGLTINSGNLNVSSGNSNVSGESNVGTFVSRGAATIVGATTLSGGVASGLTINSGDLSVSSGNSNVSGESNVGTFVSRGAATIVGAATLTGGVDSGLTVNDGGLTVTAGGLTVSAGDVSFSEDLSVSGNLYVGGTTTTVDTQNLVVTDPLIGLGNAAVNGTDLGFILEHPGPEGNVAVFYDGGSDIFKFAYTDSSITESTISPETGRSLPVEILGTLATTGDVTIGTNKLFAEGRVGIGTATPTVELEVSGDAKVSNIAVAKITFT